MQGSKFIENVSFDDITIDKMATIYQYWLDKKGDRLMPARSDIDPIEIPKILPHITLVRLEEDGRYKVTLVGSDNVRAHGTDLTGKYLDEITALYEDAKWRYDWLVENKRAYIYESKLDWSENNFLDYSVIGLPLSDNGADANILMFAAFYHYPRDRRTVESVLDE